MDTRRVSIVVPTLEHSANLEARFTHLLASTSVAEILFVRPQTAPADPDDDAPGRVRWLHAPLGRASQMNAGAQAARGEFLLFVHADTRIETASVEHLVAALRREPSAAFAFSLCFDDPGTGPRRLARLATWWGDRFPLPLGDQGLALSRHGFVQLGGFPDEPLFEDFVLVRALKRRTRVRILPDRVRTSGNRFRRLGTLRTLTANGLLLLLFQLGVPARRLVRGYYGPDYLRRWLAASPARATGRVPESSFRARLTRLLPVLTVGLLLGSPVRAIDHSHVLFDSVLARHVDGGRVDYCGLQAEDGDPQSAFSRYLDDLAGATAAEEATWSREQRLAYWINAYNAFTLKLIVDHYPIGARWYMNVLPFLRCFLPVNSILMIPGRWDEVRFASARGAITLAHIEHEILRPEFEDPRIHFAIVCASIGCPLLRDRVFRADRIDAQLGAATEDFVADPQKVWVHPDNGDLEISRIFKWFREDFDRSPPADRPSVEEASERYGKNAAVVRWLAGYGTRGLRRRIADGPYDVAHLSYDWTLNEQPCRPAE